jgi:ATP phosphoribosyltransferase
MSEVLKLGLPAGSLQQATLELLSHAGWRVRPSKRSYYPGIDDVEIEPILMRPQEMPRYIESGILDAGVCGRDWVLENGSDVVEAAAFVYAKQTSNPVRWVIAVPEASDIKTVEDLAGKRISTELVNVTRKYLADRGVEADIEFSWGATEAKVPRFADAIVELTETGSSLRANKLRIMETILESVTVIVTSKDAWANQWKRTKVETIAMMMQGAMLGREKVGLKMNAPREKLDAVLSCLEALKRPTVSPLSDGEWVAIETVMNEADVRVLIPALKAAGAEGIFEYPLNKVIL